MTFSGVQYIFDSSLTTSSAILNIIATICLNQETAFERASRNCALMAGKFEASCFNVIIQHGSNTYRSHNTHSSLRTPGIDFEFSGSKPGLKPVLAWPVPGFGFGLGFPKPKPVQAKPKP